jgi:hypothetical protein
MKRFKAHEGKIFVQERADGMVGWIGGNGCMQGVRLVPYRLPEWKDLKMVGIVEGEKDVDHLWSLGFPAVCNPGGAGKWRTEFNSLFAGKFVVILPDNDIGRLFGGHRTREKDLALDRLLRPGKVTKEKKQTQGRPVTIWKAA